MVTIFLPSNSWSTLVRQERVDAIDEHGAGGALSFAAAEFCAGTRSSRRTERRVRSGLGIEAPSGAVDGELGDSAMLL